MKRITKIYLTFFIVLINLFMVNGNAVAQICNMIGNNGSDQLTNGQCAPVNLDMPVNFSFNVPIDPSKLIIRYEWGYGTARTDIGPEKITYNASLNRYETTATHNYPANLTDNTCYYIARAYVVYDGVACTSTAQTQKFAFWNTDDKNSGNLVSAPDNFRVCKGTPWNVTFKDESDFNCRIGIEPDKPNELHRWVQYIYGTNLGGLKIPNVSINVPGVGNVLLTDNVGNRIVFGTPSTFYEGPVTLIPPLAKGPNLNSYTLSAPGSDLVGRIFDVTLRNWNICNPYRNIITDALTGNAPEITTSKVTIVDKPKADIRITKNKAVTTEPEVSKFCPGDRIYLRANTTNWLAGSAPRHRITIYNGPDDSYPVIFNRNTNTKNDTSSYKMTNGIGAGVKTVVIESYDRNANNLSGQLGCSDKMTKYIEVVPAPIAKIVSSSGKDVKFCKDNAGDSFLITFGDDPELLNPANTVFRWRFIDVNKNIDTTVGPSYGAQIPTFTDVKYKDPGAYQVIYSTEDMVTRCGTSDVVNIKIFSRPIADFELEAQQVYCASKKIIFKDLSKDFFSVSKLPEDKIIKRRWYFDYDNDPANFVELNEGEEISHLYAQSGTYKVRLEVETDIASCSNKHEKDIIIKILPAPEADFTTPPADCPGTFTFTNTSFNNQNAALGAVKYFWMIYDEEEAFIEEREGNNSTFDYIFTNNLLEDKIYKIRLKAVSENFCEYISEFKEVMVNPALPTSFSSDYDPFEPNCSPQTIEFTVDSQTKSLPGIQGYIWTINDSFGFSESIPKATNETTLTYSFLNNTNSVKTYIVSLEVLINTTSCVNPFQQPIKISPIPDPDFTINQGVEECDKVTLGFVAESKGMTYNWTITTNAVNSPFLSFPVMNDDFNIIFQRPEATDADLVVEARLEVINSTHCKRTSLSKTFTIPKKSAVDVQLDLVSADNGCHKFSADFKNATPSGYPAGTTFDFLVKKGTGAQEVKPVTSGSLSGDFTYEFESEGVFEVVLRAIAPAPDKCVFLSPPQIITVHPAVKAAFSSDAEEGCSPLTLNFTDASTSTTFTNIQEIRWIVTEVATGNVIRNIVQNPSQLFTQLFPENHTVVTQEYKVLQEVTSTMGCRDTISTRINVFPAPQSDLEVVATPICFPYDVEFRNKVINSNPANTRYLWYWGDGTFTESNEEFVTHTYSNTSFTTARGLKVTLLATTPDECTAIKELQIQVNPRVKAEIVADKTSGCAPLEVNFNNFSKGHNATLGEWYKRREGTVNFEKISADNITMMHTFENISGLDEQYEIMYIARSTVGCTDTAKVTITVFADLQATFEVTPYYQDLPERTVYITRPTNTTIPDSFDFYWEFGDGTTSTESNPGSHIFPNYGTYEITLTVNGNNCTARHIETIVIGAITPVVDFEYDPEQGCRPLRVNFTDKSLWTDVTTYHWDFGDGKGFSDARNPTYTYNEAGIYSVSLSASNVIGEVVTEKKEFIIEVFDNPRAIFQIRPTTVYLPGKPVYTSNGSINAVSYFWDFGDGTTSTEFEPKHIYTEKGVYDISLTVTNENGCTNTFILRNAVKVDDGAELKIPNAFTPNSAGPSGSGGTGGVNDIFMPITEGVVEFNMVIFNRWGEMLFESRNINDGWDGYYKGKLCKQDVYVYKINIKFIDGETATRIGDVTLLR